MKNIETETGINYMSIDCISVRASVKWEVSQIPQTQTIESNNKHFTLDEDTFKRERVIFIAPEYSTYDQKELDRIAGLIDDVISTSPPRKNLYYCDLRKGGLYLPWRGYDEVMLPQTNFSGIYKTTIKLVPDRELGQLLLLLGNKNIPELERIIMEQDITNFGKLTTDNYCKKVLQTLYGLQQLSVYLPAKLVKFLEDNNTSHPEETPTITKRDAYIKAALALGI